MISTNDGTKIKNNLKNGTVTVSLAQQNLTNKGTTVIPGVFYINDVVVRDNDGDSEIFIAAGVSSHRDAASHIFGVDDYGIWKSLDQGTTWIKVPWKLHKKNQHGPECQLNSKHNLPLP